MILCITHSKDFYTIDNVIKHIEAAGLQAVRFNTDLIYSSIELSHKVSSEGWSARLTSGEYNLKLEDIKGVWFRKCWSPEILSEVDDTYRKAVSNEIKSTLNSFFHLLEERVPCLNKLSLDVSVANDKLKQLRVAVSVGLNIPATLLSANAKEVMLFFESHNRNIVTKLQQSLSFGMSRKGKFMPTTQLTTHNIVGITESLGVCPMLFQANIPKQYELRIVYVYGKCFVGKIDTTKIEGAQTDWRNSSIQESVWQKGSIPIYVVEKINALMQKLGLLFGAIDMIVTPNEEYVFLEVNPSGEWGMLERDLNLPISLEITNTLIKHLNND